MVTGSRTFVDESGWNQPKIWPPTQRSLPADSSWGRCCVPGFVRPCGVRKQPALLPRAPRRADHVSTSVRQNVIVPGVQSEAALGGTGATDQLEREITGLRQENARLKRLLKLTDPEAAPAKGSQAAWFDQTPGPVDAGSQPARKVAFYAALFGARADVYAVRWENARYGKSGWVPAVEGGWRKGTKPSEQRYLPLTSEVLARHLTGAHHIGLYPMLPRDQTCWLAADFDGQAAMLDALAYLKAARAIGVPAALEISRSGVGAHVWIFFTEPVPAVTARQLGTRLVREAIAARGRMDLACYDRLFPSQDVIPAGGLGNLIAAPLQGKCRKDGTTVFLDLATLEPHQDQWDYLSTLERLTPRQVAKFASQLREPAVGVGVERLHPAQSTRTQPQPAPVVHVTLDGGVRIPGDELSPALYATLKHAASTANPEFYDRQRRRKRPGTSHGSSSPSTRPWTASSSCLEACSTPLPRSSPRRVAKSRPTTIEPSASLRSSC